jgi:hypothetical protein
MMLLLNFLVSVVLAPAVLAGVTHLTVKDPMLVIIVAVLSALSGLMNVWDVVIRPGPKLGADYRVPSPKNYLLISLVAYAVVIPFVLAVALWVRSEYGDKGDRVMMRMIWMVIVGLGCLWVPQSKEGPDSGEPLGTD